MQNAEEWGDERVALREKEFGIWQDISWTQYLENVKALSLGMISLGLKKGDKIVFLMDNRPEWLYLEVAAQVAGAIPVGLFPDTEDLELVQHMIDFVNARFVMAEDQEQTDKVLAVKDRLPKLEKIIVDEIQELRTYKEPLLIGLREVQQIGRKLDQEQPELFERNIASIHPDDVAFLSTTSGTTDLPKLAMLTHKGLLAMARGQDQLDPMGPSDQMVSFLPPAWVGERLFSLCWALYKGFTVCFPEEPETQQRDLREIGPQLIFSAPRIWDNMVTMVQERIKDAGWLKRAVYHIFMPIGGRVAGLRLSQKKVPLLWRALYASGEFVLYRSLRDRLGLLKARKVYTGGAPLGVDQFLFFHTIGVKMKQLYGQTEMSGVSVAQRDEDIKLGTVGKPIPGVELKISEMGEILVKGEAALVGYYKSPEAYARAFKDGWFHSGDYGYIDEDGHLVMVDRIRDMAELNDGNRFAPQYIENKLKFSPYVKEAVVFGNQQDYVTSLVLMDMETVSNWADDCRLSYTTFKDLSQKPEVYQLIKKEIERLNRGLPKVLQVRRFSLFDKELDPENQEITHTRKVRRMTIIEKYRQRIKALLADEHGDITT
ncbi:AMP-binding protein [Chloroflexota bacterium]